MGTSLRLNAYLQTDRVSRVALKAVLLQARQILRDQRLLDVARLEIHETFALVEVSLDRADISGRLPSFQGKWMHLLSDGGRRRGYVWSTPIGPAAADWLVLAAIESHLGERLASTLAWARRHIKGRHRVRALRIPECRLLALLLQSTEGDQIIIADAPTGRSLFPAHTRCSYAEFIQRAKGLPLMPSLESWSTA